MKKVIALFITLLLMFTVMCGCTAQNNVRNWGGSMTIDLEPGTKLELVTWKENDLLILTRPMHDGESAETHSYKESSSWGVFEGEILFVEHNP